MAPSRTKLYENDPKWVWKFVVRVSAIVFALISISIIGGDHGKDLFADVDGDHGKHIFAGVDGDTVAFRGIIPVRSDFSLFSFPSHISPLPRAFIKHLN